MQTGRISKKTIEIYFSQPHILFFVYNKYRSLISIIFYHIKAPFTIKKQPLKKRVWENIWQFDIQKGSFKAWLTSIARYAAINRTRNIPDHTSVDELSENTPSFELTPEEAVIRQDRKNAVVHALQRISPEERILFYRKYYYLQPTSQIASELGMTERAVEGKLYRLKKRLRKILGGESKG